MYAPIYSSGKFLFYLPILIVNKQIIEKVLWVLNYFILMENF